MNLNKLEIVVLLHRYKKVTAVARELGVKQPTVTFHMKSLEEEYGVQLFEMRAGKVWLTEAGEALHHYALKIRSLAGEAGRVVSEYQSMGRGSIRIGASYVPGTYMLSDLLLHYSEQYPQISVSLEIKTAPVIHGMLLDHSLDLGIISAQEGDMPGIYSEALMEDELMLVFPPGHPFVGRSDLQPSDLARENFIYHDAQSSTRRMTAEWARQQQVELKSKLELNSIEIIKRSVIRGHGITFMSKLAILEELQRGELVSMPVPCWQLKRSVYCCYHKDRWLTAPMRALLQLIRSERQRPFSDLSNPTPPSLHIMK